MDLLNRTGAEIGYYLYQNQCKKIIFITEKIKKYRKCPALNPLHVCSGENVQKEVLQDPGLQLLRRGEGGKLRHLPSSPCAGKLNVAHKLFHN